MSATPNDGGPAFPHHEVWDEAKPEIGWIGGGMSLRDYFAAHAPPADQEWLNTYARNEGVITPGWVNAKTSWAYYWADSMLKARQPSS